MALGFAQKTYKEIMEDWTGAENLATSAADGVRWLISSDGGDTAPTITATAAGPLLRYTSAATDDNMGEVAFKDLTWSVQNGELMLETRLRLDVITNIAFNVGFNDDALEDSNTLPMELSTTTFTANAATWVGVVFDVDATNDDVHVMWVDDSTASTEAIADLRMSGMAPVANQWMGINVRLQDRGSGNGARLIVEVVEESTGKHIIKRFNTNVDRDVLLTPHIGFENRTASAHVCDVDYFYVRQSRN